MPVTSHLVSKYSIELYSSGTGSSQTAVIRLKDANGRQVAWVSFYAAGTAIPANAWRSSSSESFAQVGYPESALPSFVDVLRNEAPLAFYWFDYPDRKFGELSTSLEPIGEGDGV